VPGRGFPVVGQDARGDFVVAFDIEFPERLDDGQKELLQSLLPDGADEYE